MKLEWSEFKSSCKIALLYLLSLEATKVLIENDLNASKTLNVPTAEFFLPVKGYTSGPLWHELFKFTLQTKLANVSISGPCLLYTSPSPRD